MIKYVYPHLPSIRTFPFFRYSGSGLGNSLFVFARAIVFAKENNLQLINPTWLNFDPVQWKLWSRDKRLYNDIFHPVGVTGLKRMRLLLFGKKCKEEEFESNKMDSDWVEIFFMKGFKPLIGKSELVREYLLGCIRPEILIPVEEYNFDNKIAVHIRFGDYKPENRLKITYYSSLINQIHSEKPEYEFLVFSDGNDDELKEVLDIPCTERVFFGNAMSDIIAISKCASLISSHSTFSDWGGYLGQIPTLLPETPHYGSYLEDLNCEFILSKENPIIPSSYFNYLKK